MSTNPCAAAILVPAGKEELPPECGESRVFSAGKFQAELAGAEAALSAWSRSRTKRIFDCACVVAALPMLIPALLLLTLLVRTTSRGPVFFLQRRVGRWGRPFTILKLRTLQPGDKDCPGIQRFTAIGRWLRLWKLDELPQLFNVLAGDMSLVGPRPKMREYQLGEPVCRPGVTGAATIAFAREEELLQDVLKLRSAEAYRSVVMPAKHRLDAEYMARATFLSDLKLIVNSLLRRWDVVALQAVIGPVNLNNPAADARRRLAPLQGPALPRLRSAAPADAATNL